MQETKDRLNYIQTNANELYLDVLSLKQDIQVILAAKIAEDKADASLAISAEVEIAKDRQIKQLKNELLHMESELLRRTKEVKELYNPDMKHEE